MVDQDTSYSEADKNAVLNTAHMTDNIGFCNTLPMNRLFESACTIQIRAQSRGGGELLRIADAIIAGAAASP